MELTAEQKSKISEWVRQGDSLSEIQKKLQSELNIALTYMEVRFLMDDLKVAVKDRDPRPAVPDLKAAVSASEDAPCDGDAGEAGLDEDAGNVSVGVDRVIKAGALASGTVRFSDGVKGSWILDAAGRLGLTAEKQGYRPSEQDLHSFQAELGRELQKRGMY